MSKISIRFYKDRKVRAVWDEEKKEQSEVVSATTQLKLTASDGKKYNTDVISQDGVDWSKIDKKEYLKAMRHSTTDSTTIKALLQEALTDKIDDREIFMKGIDYSYYYEQEE